MFPWFISNCRLPIANLRRTSSPKLEIGNWQLAMTLFIPERFERIDFCCPACRYVTRQQRHHDQHNQHNRERQRISRADTKQQTLQNAGGCKRERQTKHRSNCDQDHTLSNDELEYVSLLCAESDTNSDLVRALRGRVSHHSVDTDCGKQEGAATEDTQQHRHHAIAGKLTSD